MHYSSVKILSTTCIKKNPVTLVDSHWLVPERGSWEETAPGFPVAPSAFPRLLAPGWGTTLRMWEFLTFALRLWIAPLSLTEPPNFHSLQKGCLHRFQSEALAEALAGVQSGCRLSDCRAGLPLELPTTLELELEANYMQS